MRYISFKVLIICILLPPLLYLATVNYLESYLTRTVNVQVRNIYLSDITDMLNGLVRVREGVNNSIDQYLKGNLLEKLGVQIDITVATRDGNIIYPSTFQNEATSRTPSDPLSVAQANFAILNAGLQVEVNVIIKHYSLLALAILMFYIIIFMSGLYVYYHKVMVRIRREDEKRTSELDRLHTLEKKRQERIQNLALERKSLLDEYQSIQQRLENEKLMAEKAEIDLFDEIESLELKLKENLSLQEQQHEEIDNLKEKIGDLEKTRETANRHKEKAADKLSKRFKVLYKNIDITDRALSNLADMNDDAGLKAEELIHQLNDDASLVTVKRKVFSKKGKVTAFEVVFSYNGRLYFRRADDNRIEILTIGTKNSQTRDLAYLDTIT